MQFEIKLYRLVVYFLVLGCLKHESSEASKIEPYRVPYIAGVRGDTYDCTGILISEYYVIMPAYCVEGSTTMSLHLGFHEDSRTWATPAEGTQVLLSSEIKIHPGFSKIDEYRYVNNIALVKTASPATLTKTVQLGLLTSKEDSQLLLNETFLNVSGWYIDNNADLGLTQIYLQDQNTCALLFKDKFFSGQEFCGRWKDPAKRVYASGNPVSGHGKIMGYITESPCSATYSKCTDHTAILSIVPFLKWIADETNISKSVLTGSQFVMTVLNDKIQGHTLEDRLVRLETKLEQIQDSLKQMTRERQGSRQDLYNS